MGLIHIMARGDDEATQRFEDAMYDIKDAVSEACDIYEQMKAEFAMRDGSFDTRSYYRNSGARMSGRGYGERRGGRH